MTVTLNELDGLVGEAWAGEAPNGSHINLVIGVRGTPTAATIGALLGDTRPLHQPFLACLGAGNAVRPATVVRNKTPLDNDEIERLTWGAVHLGVARGVTQALQESMLPRQYARDLILLISVWTDASARSDHALLDATYGAINNAITCGTDAEISELIARGTTATNDFYREHE